MTNLPPLRIYTTDGCSGGMSKAWRALLGRNPPWQSCCEDHDLTYWQGGTREDRRNADIDLMICVADGGHPIWAFLMWAVVRIGGHPVWPNIWPFSKWRWGYGRRRGWSPIYDRCSLPSDDQP